MWCRIGELGVGLEVPGDDLVGCFAAQHALAPGVVGLVEAAQQLFQGTVRVDVDAQHFGANPGIEALHHAAAANGSAVSAGLRRAWLYMAILDAKALAGLGEGRGEAAAVVGQHMGEPKRKGSCGLAQEGDGAPLGFVVLDGEVDGTRATVDGDEQVSLAAFAVAGLQLGQVLDVDMDEAEVVVMTKRKAFAPGRCPDPWRGAQRWAWACGSGPRF